MLKEKDFSWLGELAMQVTLEIPDDIVRRLQEKGTELPRRLLETIALDGYRSGELSHAEVGQLLGLSRYEVDGFLKAGGAYLDYQQEDLEADTQTLCRLGFE
jgi:predicted HTH domain antitoxin